MEKPDKSSKMWAVVDDEGVIVTVDHTKGLLDVFMFTNYCCVSRAPIWDKKGFCTLPECPFVTYGEECRRFKATVKIGAQG